MRHFEVKDVLSWATREEAKQYIGQYVFFNDTLAGLADDVENGDYFLLSDVQDDTSSCFHLDAAAYYPFFLPVDKVKKVEEKKWRTFNSNEFSKLFKVGDVLTIKYPELGEIKTLLTSIRENANQITLGGFNDECFETLFSDGVQILLNGEWQPFGVLENES